MATTNQLSRVPGERSRLPLEKTARILRESGIQSTQQRLEIASYFLARPQHCSAEEVHSQVRLAGSRVSKATVYNTLRLFAERGLVREVLVDRSHVFFDSNPVPHQHFYNLVTGELTDVDKSAVRITAMPAPPAGTTIADIDVVIRVRPNAS